MKTSIRLAVLMLIMLIIAGHSIVIAQSVVVPVEIPIEGRYAFAGKLPGAKSTINSTQLFLLDTFTGAVQMIATDELLIDSPKWDSVGNRLSFLNGPTTEVWSMVNNEATILPMNRLSPVESWSPDDRSLLYSTYDSSTIPATETLKILDLSSSVSTTIFSYQSGQILNNVPLPPLPDEVTQFTFYEIRQADWNPGYPEWIVVQLLGVTPDIIDFDWSDGALFPVTFLYNLQTGQFISLDQLFTTHISGTRISWSLDGRFLALQTDETGGGKTHLVAFEYDGQTATLQVIDSAHSGYQVMHNWIGAGDLLLSVIGDDTGDAIHYISQIIDGTWYSTEFFRLPASVFDRTGSGDWFITASETEKQHLTCIFDQAMPSRVVINQRARVNFTTGTPLRLRSEPNFDSTVLLEMPEGTEFTVIGGSACVNSDSYYRFWQIELEDGTIGWAAEADNSEYFIEPIG